MPQEYEIYQPENGYWHPERGYSEFIAPPSPEDITALPEGTRECPKKPGDDYTFDEDAWDWVHTPPPEPTPEELRAQLPSITPRQLRLTLVRAGVSPGYVEDALHAIPNEQEREEALIEWEYATSFERLHPLILALAPALDLTEEQVDALWDQALDA